MSLAPFFDKAALAASHILQSFDLSAFIGTLNNHVIGIAFDNAGAASSEGLVTLNLAVNLLARLYPRLRIVALEKNSNTVVSQLMHLAQEINPNIEIGTNFSDIDVCVVVGEHGLTNSIPAIFVGSDGWITQVSSKGPVGSGCTHNPFGAGAAACFGAANIFRILFQSNLQSGVPDNSFTLSLLTYETNRNNLNNLNNPELLEVDLGESHLVGLGAIGNGAVWALARLPKVRGTLHLIDDEDIELSNAQRYVLATPSSCGTSKVRLAAKILSSTQLNVVPHQQRWGEYMAETNNWSLQSVAVAVDSAIARYSVQSSLPKWIVNAWTQPGDLGISRHNFVGDQACLMCLYLPSSIQKSDDQIVAEAIGLPDAVMNVRTLLYTDHPVGEEFLDRVAAALKIPVAPLIPFANQPLRAFYSKAVCGGIVLNLGGDYKNAIRAEVPMAFQSVLAGIMLAAELVAHSSGLKQTSTPAQTRIDLLRPLGEYLSIPASKHPSGHCICQDPDYIAAYYQKYPDTLGSNPGGATT